MGEIGIRATLPPTILRPRNPIHAESSYSVIKTWSKDKYFL